VNLAPVKSVSKKSSLAQIKKDKTVDKFSQRMLGYIMPHPAAHTNLPMPPMPPMPIHIWSSADFFSGFYDESSAV